MEIGSNLNLFLDKIMKSFDSFNKQIAKDPLILLNSWIFRFVIGAIFYLLFPTKFMAWLWVNVLFELLKYIFVIIDTPLVRERIIDKLWIIFLGLMGFLLMKVLVEW